MKKIILFLFLATLIAGSSCKKSYLETDPTDAVDRTELFKKINNIYAALDGAVTAQFAFGAGGSGRHDNYGQKSWDLSMDLMGNDMVVHSQGFGWYNAVYNYTEWLNPATGRQSYNAWYFYYDIIRQALFIIENVDKAIDGNQAQKELLKGQALGLKAYANYYLANLFQQTYKGHENSPGNVLYTEFSQANLPRAPLSEVYANIVSDLTQAETLLSGKPRTNKTYIDLSVVRGLRARVALVMEDWATAATKANQARQGYTLMTSAQYTALNAFSSISNAEWMWGSIIPEDQATIYASFFSHMDINTGGYAALGGQKKITKELYDLIPADDVRKSVFRTPGTGAGSNVDYNQNKHRVPNPGSWAADYLYMRAAEMYLIEAEALARQGQDPAARTALEALVITRQPSFSAAALSGTALLNEILLQRRIELWGEGFSLIDVKRLGNGLNRPSGPGNHGAPNFNPAVYTSPAVEPRWLMRIPLDEILFNTSIGDNDQNP